MNFSQQFFQLAVSLTRFVFDASLTVYAYLVLLYFAVFDFVALTFKGLVLRNVSPDDRRVVDYVAWSLSGEQEEALELYDSLFVPILSFFYITVANSMFLRAFYFFVFIVPFTHLTNISVSNEYLLFCCILFTLFMVYDWIVETLNGVFAPSIDSLRTLVSKKLLLLSEITAYQSALLSHYALVSISFEEFCAVLEQTDSNSAEVDEVLFDQAVHSSTLTALSSLLVLEQQSAIYSEFIEQAELDETVLEELIGELGVEEEDN
jgi:hypothetical protein